MHTTKFVDKLLITWISVPTFDLNIASFFFLHFSSPLISLTCVSSEAGNLQAVFVLHIILAHKKVVGVPGLASRDGGNWE